jgi:hypothetical protein
MTQLRKSSDLGYLWYGKGRANMVRVCKNLGITDICTCQDAVSLDTPFRMRPDSGSTGMKECAACHHLLWPLMYVYDCDSCTEPTLSENFPVGLDVVYLCIDCALGD